MGACPSSNCSAREVDDREQHQLFDKMNTAGTGVVCRAHHFYVGLSGSAMPLVIGGIISLFVLIILTHHSPAFPVHRQSYPIGFLRRRKGKYWH